MKSMHLNKLSHISMLKNIALICVVLGHAGCIYAGKWNFDIINSESKLIKYITEYIYSFHMPLFVFISGYVYNYGREKLGKYNSIKEFIVNKFKRLIIPYILTGIFFMIPIQTFFSIYEDKNSLMINKCINYILFAQKPGHLWYLLMMFNLFIIFRMIETSLNKGNLILNLAILEAISIVSMKIPNIYYISSSFNYLIYFYIGYILCRNIDEIKINLRKNKKIYLIANIILFNADYILINYVKLNSILLKIGLKLLNSIVAIVAIICLIAYIIELTDENKKFEKIIESKIYKIIDKNNFKIYLFHQPIILSAISMMENVSLTPMLFYLVLFTVGLIISLLISTTLEQIKFNLLKLRNKSIEKLNI